MANSEPSRRLSPEKRRATILSAAAEVFFEQGYAATSIDAIIARIGGSKRNIYNEFGSKEGLFTALVSETAGKARTALDVDDFEERDLDQTLLEIGRRLLDVYMSPTLIGVLRTVMAEAARFPDLARAFYENGPGQTSARLAEVLETARARGEIDVADCLTAANHFCGMLRDNLHMQVVLGLRPAPAPDEIERLATSVVGIFLDGARARRAGIDRGRMARLGSANSG
ncbi:TetR/AcrR family transcriptional regulator [Rhizobiaceae bacterium n13]|uniref:TetR/AcrR family transcriptional regulator n=1 Tax=Ferirhizobium litorale TaxID=2927786 RepID=A0AAE3U3X0_9HYPH|nr:TetR/AcrR family transcriptional regulator [Fererhizobium litorale]MDI7864911.1 TetR/AcrR family transcriptional regulator [Fererhizobium litorale]MDI7925031.1 TetR/AcrR family transcriptional regulator [Fererhizobium litorale]